MTFLKFKYDELKINISYENDDIIKSQKNIEAIRIVNDLLNVYIFH